MKLDINKIKEILPQRHPFLLVDGVDELIPGKSAKAFKCVTYNEDFFEGHFPDEPVMPGVLIVEALAQTGALAILSTEENNGKTAVFGGIDNLRFRKKVIPGDRLTLECEIIRAKGPVGTGKVRASVDGETAAAGELTFFVQKPGNN